MSSYLELLTPQNSQLIIIDQQPQMAFGVQSIDRQMLKNNVVALAKSAKVFKVPTTITTVETEGFSGHAYPELLAVFPPGSRPADVLAISPVCAGGWGGKGLSVNWKVTARLPCPIMDSVTACLGKSATISQVKVIAVASSVS